MTARDEEFQKTGQDGDEIDEAEEAEGVTPAVANDPESGDILEGEENGKGPLERFEEKGMIFAEFVDAFEHQGENTEKDQGEEAKIESAAGAGIGEEDDAPEGVAAGGLGRDRH